MSLSKKLTATALSVLIISTATLFLSMQARAETVNCTPITLVPYTINMSGVYCLKQDFVIALSSGSAIAIAANDVTLDFNGFTVDGGGSVGDGVRADSKSNLTIRNGEIRGFSRGIFIYTPTSGYTDSRAHIVEDMKLTDNLLAGINISAIGSIIRGNVVSNTGGSSAASPVAGIYAAGTGNVVSNNVVENTDGTLGAGYAGRGIWVSQTDGSVVRGNTVTNTKGTTGTYGINTYPSLGSLLRDNYVSGASNYGVVMNSPADKYMSTITHNVGTSYYSGTAIGHNN